MTDAQAIRRSERSARQTLGPCAGMSRPFLGMITSTALTACRAPTVYTAGRPAIISRTRAAVSGAMSFRIR